MPEEHLDPKKLLDKYLELKDKIIDGSISPEETRELYDEFKKFGKDSNTAKAVENMMKDLDKTIEPEMLHGFVSKLVEVEKQAMNERHPILETDSPEKIQEAQKGRCADYMRNTSLAKNAMRYEFTKNGLGQEIYQSLKKGNTEEAQTQMADFQVPDYLQDHYSNIKQFYKENGNEAGAVKNLSFHAISTAVTMCANEEYAAKKISPQELSSVAKGMAGINKALYSSGDNTARDKLMAQIPETPGDVTIEFKPREKTFGQKVMQVVGNMVETVQKSTIVQAIKNVFSKKDKTPVVAASSSPEVVSTKPEGEKASPLTKEQKAPLLTKEQKTQAQDVGTRARANAMSSDATRPGNKSVATPVVQKEKSGGMDR